MALTQSNITECFSNNCFHGNNEISQNTSNKSSCRLDTGTTWMAPHDVISASANCTAVCNSQNSPRHPKYKDHSARLESFVAWPGKYVSQTPEQLSVAGFFYIGSADRVTCFRCGITLRDWLAEHDPVEEHKRYAPNCDFVNGMTSEVQTVTMTEELNSQKSQTAEHSALGSSVTEYEQKSFMDLKSASESLTTGIDDLHLEEADDTHEEQMVIDETSSEDSEELSHHTPSSSENKMEQFSDVSKFSVEINDDLIETVKTKKAKRHASLVVENLRLKEESSCRMCKSNSPSILFLPCGHLVTCQECADKVDSCFICGKTILGTVKTFRA